MKDNEYEYSERKEMAGKVDGTYAIKRHDQIMLRRGNMKKLHEIDLKLNRRDFLTTSIEVTAGLSAGMLLLQQGAIAAQNLPVGNSGASLELTRNNALGFKIVVPKDSGIVIDHAAQELQDHLEEIIGAEITIEHGDGPGRYGSFYIGDSEPAKQIIPDEEISPLGDEGFIVRVKGNAIAVRGGSPRGTLYGVFSLLEDELGVRWYTKTEKIVPSKEAIDFTGIDYSQKPAFEYRLPYFAHARDGDWGARNRCNGDWFLFEEKHGGKIEYLNGQAHTFCTLVPADKYWDEHPEYYSVYQGKRNPTYEEGQLCLTNPDLLETMKKEVLDLAETAKGRPAIINVSQNDNWHKCECEKCRAMDEKEGSPAGTLLRFVNAVADEVALKYPNIKINTLAYMYTEEVPKITKPRPNVVVSLCHFAPNCEIHPLGKCFWNEKYIKNLRGWSKISACLYLWDYAANFWHYLTPFPNLYAITKDIPFHYEHKVRGILFLGDMDAKSPVGDMSALKAWLIAKLLWNPYRDATSLIKDFVKNYYGPAAPAMMEYILVQNKHVSKGNKHAGMYDSPDLGYLDANVLKKMYIALLEAEKLARGTEYAERVRRHRYNFTYLQLHSPQLFDPKDDSHPGSPEERLALLEQFEKDLPHFQVSELHELVPVEETLKMLRDRIIESK